MPKRAAQFYPIEHVPDRFAMTRCSRFKETSPQAAAQLSAVYEGNSMAPGTQTPSSATLIWEEVQDRALVGQKRVEASGKDLYSWRRHSWLSVWARWTSRPQTHHGP
jgi:hypothetical protein